VTTKRRPRFEIEGLARQLLDEAGVTKPPINVERLAKFLDYPIVYQRFAGDISGTVLLEDDDSVTIGINSYHPRVRQRFSVAHEIGHAKLHMGKGKDRLFVDPPARQLFRDAEASLGEDPREVQANQYAAALLMPRPLVVAQGQDLVERNPRIGIEQLVATLGDRFEVSSQAMRYRLVTLGILEPD
jgi:Zn-dependent peptidase ImmA (M78 family)